jgi:hypothetical protein
VVRISILRIEQHDAKFVSLHVFLTSVQTRRATPSVPQPKRSLYERQLRVAQQTAELTTPRSSITLALDPDRNSQ